MSLYLHASGVIQKSRGYILITAGNSFAHHIGSNMKKVYFDMCFSKNTYGPIGYYSSGCISFNLCLMQRIISWVCKVLLVSIH